MEDVFDEIHWEFVNSEDFIYFVKWMSELKIK
jgi:hypothetical protein